VELLSLILIGSENELLFKVGLGLWDVLGLFLLYRSLRKTELRISLPASSLYIWLVFSVLVLAFIALYSAPNNWDSMTYHLSRVANWDQNGSIHHYLTGIDRQISQPPAAEYLILHSYSLFGTDRFANLVQFFALLSCMAGLWHFMSLMGTRRKQSLWTIFILITLPIAICQATSTQNDLVVASYLLWLLVFGTLAYQEKQYQPLMGLAAAMAILTKGTALLFGIPLGLFLLYQGFRQRGKAYGRAIVWSVILILLLNGPHWSRNAWEFGGPLGPSYTLSNEIISLESIFSNGSKNAAVQLKSSWKSGNEFLEKATYSFHNVLKLDVNDGRYHWPGSPGFRVSYETRGEYFHEDYATNPLHFMLILIALISAFLKGDWRWKAYAASILFAFVFFSFTLRWQIWHPRLLLVWYILAIPLVALMLEKWKASLRMLASICLIAYAWPFLMQNESRALLGEKSMLKRDRMEQYFANRPAALQPYLKLEQIINDNNVERIGLQTSGDSWEYPIWLIAKGKQINHVKRPPFSGHRQTNHDADMLLNWKYELDEEQVKYKNKQFELVLKGEHGAPSVYLVENYRSTSANILAD
jgi:4-amino-4-deoxy-L-arabinose transferase-like glycosyltransferase